MRVGKPGPFGKIEFWAVSARPVQAHRPSCMRERRSMEARFGAEALPVVFLSLGHGTRPGGFPGSPASSGPPSFTPPACPPGSKPAPAAGATEFFSAGPTPSNRPPTSATSPPWLTRACCPSAPAPMIGVLIPAGTRSLSGPRAYLTGPKTDHLITNDALFLAANQKLAQNCRSRTTRTSDDRYPRGIRAKRLDP